MENGALFMGETNSSISTPVHQQRRFSLTHVLIAMVASAIFTAVAIHPSVSPIAPARAGVVAAPEVPAAAATAAAAGAAAVAPAKEAAVAEPAKEAAAPVKEAAVAPAKEAAADAPAKEAAPDAPAKEAAPAPAAPAPAKAAAAKEGAPGADAAKPAVVVVGSQSNDCAFGDGVCYGPAEKKTTTIFRQCTKGMRATTCGCFAVAGDVSPAAAAPKLLGNRLCKCTYASSALPDAVWGMKLNCMAA